ncbi:MAG: sulfurtransferase [Bacteroidetes bacterium]|jgi:thiosulfate/3-mercaptopyruvate sulfurtransferase|nr:sulfurtransferase [Bacteroidota bacterium]
MLNLPSIIQIEEFKKLINQKNTIILDARATGNAKEQYLEKHLKGARFIELDTDLASVTNNPSKGGRHPLPDIFDFSKTLSDLGVREDSNIIIYDDKAGANAAARCWWLLKSFGINSVSVLSGGFQALSDFEMSSGEEHFHPSTIKIPDHWKLPIVTIDEVENLLKNKKAIVIDVRDNYRYIGESEPIDPVAGHIPGAINIPLTENIDEHSFFHTQKFLKEKYQDYFKDSSKEIIIHCGSGVTACHTILAMDFAGLPIPKLFVGSWSEWCRSNRPIAKGEN